MFQSARFKLTGWYLLIVALICIFFSFAFYKASTREFDRIKRIQEFRQNRGDETLKIRPQQSEISLQSINDAEDRLLLSLILTDIFILLISSFAAYFLAGRTLRPIKDMVDEQNRFITDASHELRTPLTSLKSEIEVNLRDKNLKLNNVKNLLKSNLEEVNNLQSLADHLIALTQYQKQNNHLSVEVVNTKVITDEAVKRVNNLAKQKKINLINQVKSVDIRVNKQSIIDVLVILLENAIKYSPMKTKVTIDCKKLGEAVEISVFDQGVGIEEKEIEHIFDRFYRTDKSRTKTDVSGYGLGLSIAKQIVERHSGLIRVQSVVNKGSVFRVHLPQRVD